MSYADSAPKHPMHKTIMGLQENSAGKGPIFPGKKNPTEKAISLKVQAKKRQHYGG